MNAIIRAALAITLLGPLLSVAAQPAAPAKHDEQNPLFKRLVEDGLEVGPKVKTKFPAPTMADGLEAKKQTEIIKGLIAKDYAYDEFTRVSVLAPQLMKIRDVAGADPKTPARGVDVWFVVHGDVKLLDDDKFLDKLLTAGKAGGGGGKGGPLDPKELAARNIVIKKGDEKRESYGTIEFDFLEKVRLKATGHAMWSRNDTSIVAAAEIDPRFLNDKEFPNQWRSITKDTGAVKIGDPNPWSGAAMYVKVTKLAEPAGAMFVEQHIVFVEPKGWFDGTNLLGSKLPIAVQDNVRTMRREFLKKK